MENKYLGRIRALLERAEHPNTNEEEKQACLAKAELLRAKYSIEEWELEQADPGRATQPIKRRIRISSGGTPFIGHLMGIWSAVSEHCNVRFKMAYEMGHSYAVAYGFESDISFAEMLFAMAALEMHVKIEPGWSKDRSFDENVWRLKEAGQKWVEIALLANKNGGNPRTGQPGSTTDGSWLRTAYARQCEKMGVKPTRQTQRHAAYRRSFADGFVAEIRRRLWVMRQAADKLGETENRLLPAIVSRKDRVNALFYLENPDLHPDEIRRRNAAADAAEAARRAALSDKEREAEDRENERWRKRAERTPSSYDERGWEAGAEAARSVDLSGGERGVKHNERGALK